MWREELRRLIDATPADGIEDAIGELEAGKARLYTRLVSRPQNAGSLKCYNAAKVAEMLGRDISWVRRHQADLGAVKADGAVLFPESGLRQFLGLHR